TACPARTSIVPPACVTRSIPLSTTVYSSNSGVCPGSTQPDGLRMCATLTAAVFELTRPTYSSICFGRVPAARMRVGWVTCSGMEPRERRRGREHGRRLPGELVETRAHTGFGCDRGRKLDVGFVVPRLGGEQAAVERHERAIVERVGEQPHALAAPRLDERRAEQRVDQAVGLARPDGPHEVARVRARPLVAHGDATRREMPEHLLEVAELLASQAGERRQELPALGVLEEQAHRRRRRLLLAVGVVEQDLVQALERALDPRAARLRGEAEHPTLRPRAAARARRAREPRTRPRLADPAPSAPRSGGYQATTTWSTGSERTHLAMTGTPLGWGTPDPRAAQHAPPGLPWPPTDRNSGPDRSVGV